MQSVYGILICIGMIVGALISPYSPLLPSINALVGALVGAGIAYLFHFWQRKTSNKQAENPDNTD